LILNLKVQIVDGFDVLAKNFAYAFECDSCQLLLR
jgi:hypothetical protein